MGKYFGNDNQTLSDIFAKRTVESDVSYIVPVLDSLPRDFVLLDIGCGPASITLDIARRYPSATILGVDQPEAIARARENADKAGVTNVRFTVGDAMNMAAIAENPGFEAVLGGCDVVHTHQVHVHVQDPAALVKQLRSAAKPQGGFVCCREVDIGMITMWPVTPSMESMISAMPKLFRLRGQDPFAGRKLFTNCLAAGFKGENCRSSMDALMYVTPEKRLEFLAFMGSSMWKGVSALVAEQTGVESSFKQDLLDWARSDNGFLAMPCSQIVCQRCD